MGGRALNSGIFLMVLATGAGVQAQEAAHDPFSTACPRLSTRDKEELGARVQLLLRALAEAPQRVVLACDRKAAWLEWDGPPLQEFEVDTRAGLVEGALDAIEDRVRAGSAPISRGSGEAGSFGEGGLAGYARGSETRGAGSGTGSQSEPVAVKGSEAPPPVDQVERAPTRSSARLGGAGLGLVIEPMPSEILAMGPRLDVGVGVGPVSIVVNEGVRLGGSDEHNFMIMDLSAGVGYGAPFDPGKILGVLGTVGIEWATGYPSGSSGSSHVSASGTLTLGVRGAGRIAGAAFWVGVDGRWRAAATPLGPYSLELPQVAGMFSVGGALLVDGAPGTSTRFAGR